MSGTSPQVAKALRLATPHVTRLARPELVAGIFIVLSFLIVWPVGEYVIEDDWSYTRSLLHLHDTGALKILDWNPMTLVTHVLWGALFTKTLGFSFTIAKLSTVILLLVECLALIALLRHLGTREATITMAVLTLVFNPLHFFQSFLYATDVPALAWSMLALLFYAKGLTGASRTSYGSLLCASFFAALAGGVRQSGILVMGALFVYLLLFDRARLRDPKVWLCCCLLPLLAMSAFVFWYHLMHGPTASYLAMTEDVLRYLRHLPAHGAAQIVYILFSYVGFFLFPLLAATPLRRWMPLRTAKGKVAIVACAGFLVTFLWMTFSQGTLFPYLRNKITMFGFLSPNEVIVGARDVLWTSKLGWVASFVVFLGAVGFTLRWASGGHEGSEIKGERLARRATLRLVGVLFVTQLAYSFVTMGIAFDRHVLAFLPTALVLFIGTSGQDVSPRTSIVAVCLFPFAFYSLAGTHDVHAFSRAAFKAGQDLIAKGVEPRMIEAGYAFDGWHMYERSRREILEEQKRPLTRPDDAWYVAVIAPRILTKFVVSLSETMHTDDWSVHVSPWARSIAFVPKLHRYRRLIEYRYINYWPMGDKKLYVLEDMTLPGHEDLERIVSGAPR